MATLMLFRPFRRMFVTLLLTLLCARGVEEASGCVETVTSSVKGYFADKREVRSEFYDLVKINGR
jgi:GTP cyclohydrolase I